MSVNPLENAAQPKPRRWLRWLLDIVMITLLIMGFRLWQHHGLLDGAAPTFVYPALNGQTIDLQAYRGKPVLLHFWATWCPMCHLEQDSISVLHQDQQWQVLTVAFQSGKADDVRRYVERENLRDWIIIADEDGKLSNQYGIQVVPTTYVLDAKGNIRFREVGLTSSWGLRIRLWLTAWLYP